MILKLHYANRLKEVPYAVQLIESINGKELETTFLNFGIEQGKEANTYAIQIPHPIKENTTVQFRGMLTNNNSFSIFLFKELDNAILPIDESKQLKQQCTIEYLPRPDQTRDKEFIKFTFELEELPVTKIVSKVERETQIKIWETYIRAIKALFKNQEDLFKILDINEPNKDIIDVKIEKEDWKKILISELGEQFPQFPLIKDSKGKFEFSFDTEELQNEDDQNETSTGRPRRSSCRPRCASRRPTSPSTTTSPTGSPRGTGSRLRLPRRPAATASTCWSPPTSACATTRPSRGRARRAST